MILSGLEIIRQIELGQIVIDPFERNRVNANSYNLCLYNKIYVYKDKILDMKSQLELDEITIPETGLTLQPDQLYLGRTYEYTRTESFVPMLEGRSSIGRLGLNIHVTAGFGDVGFRGYWTLEMHCIYPTIIYPMVEICQIYYHTISGDYEKYNSGKYQDNTGVQPSLLYRDFDSRG